MIMSFKKHLLALFVICMGDTMTDGKRHWKLPYFCGWRSVCVDFVHPPLSPSAYVHGSSDHHCCAKLLIEASFALIAEAPCFRQPAVFRAHISRLVNLSEYQSNRPAY